MKINLLSSAFALLALCSTVTLLSATGPVAPRRSTDGITLAAAKVDYPINGETVTIGTSRSAVALRLGQADTVLADGSWLYGRYLAQSNDRKFSESGTLVVRFAADKVIALTLASKMEVAALGSTRVAPSAPLDRQ